MRTMTGFVLSLLFFLPTISWAWEDDGWVDGGDDWVEEDDFERRHSVPNSQNTLLVARVERHTPEEIEELLKKAQVLFEKSGKYPNFTPVVLILHGSELSLFRRTNYGRYRHIVELAAHLDTIKAVDVKVCEAQMQIEGITAEDLPAFVETVPYGPTEEARLLTKGYRYF